MARYSLIAENKDTGNRVLIRVKERGDNGIETYKEKVNLSTIDKYTLNFDNEEQLSILLSETGIIPFKNAKFYIEYISKKQAVKLPIAFRRLSRLPYFASNAPVKVSVVDPKYIETINSFLGECLDEDFLSFQIKEGYLHEYNAYYVKEYIRLLNEDGCPRQIDRLRSLIYTELNRYKRIRGLIVGSYEYYQNIIDNTPADEIIESDDPDETVFGYGYAGDRLTNQSDIDEHVKRIGIKY